MLSIVLLVVVLSVAMVNARVVVTDCSDGVDNDGDGNIDYPADSGCDDASDRSENVVFYYADGCFVKGDALMNVFGDETYECEHDKCYACVSVSEIGNSTTLTSRCYGLPKCGFGGAEGGSFELDVTPPELIVRSPENDDVFDSRKVLFDLNVNEESDIYYLDNINGRGRWSRIAGGVEGDYLKSISFKDGLNDITIKAVDSENNPVEVDRVFYVDSKEPKIRKTYPKKGFASGLFEIEFSEENPVEVVLFYGVDSFPGVELNIDSECSVDRGKYYCSKEVDLQGFDGDEIEYWFEIKDIADNVDESKHVVLEVDTSKPEVLNPDDFWVQGEGRYERYVYFNIEINENNFDEVSYFYEDTRGNLRERRLCSRLRDGVCSIKKSFRSGESLLNIQVVDEAGNVKILPVNLDVVY